MAADAAAMIIDRTMTADKLRALEATAMNAWPALQTLLIDGGWLQRFAGGFTKRSNSACPFGPEAVPVERVFDRIVSLYRAHGQTPLFRLPPLGDPGDAVWLERQGFERFEDTYLMRAALSSAARRDPAVNLSSAATELWIAGFSKGNRYGAQFRPVLEAMLAQIKPRTAYATLFEDGRAIAYGLAVLDGDDVGLFDILVEADRRGRGVGRRLVGTLMAWGAAEGASRAYLQVLGTNVAARALYRRLGFTDLYLYGYFRPAP